MYIVQSIDSGTSGLVITVSRLSQHFCIAHLDRVNLIFLCKYYRTSFSKYHNHFSPDTVVDRYLIQNGTQGDLKS